MIRHRVRVLATLLGVGVAAFFAFHAAAQPAAPGRFLSWVTNPSGAQRSPAAVVQGALPTASPTATPAAGQGPLGALTVPLSGLLQQLNTDTKTTANGQYSILQELENALRDRIDEFLNWVSARH
jgi:ABC-type glycerol-3-phosphate transport system substrate-binding protein